MNTTIYQHIIKNQGITYSIKNKKIKKTGYVVSINKNTEKTIPAKDFEQSEKYLYNYIKDNLNTLLQESQHLGAWYDNGIVYLDCSIVLDNREQALQLAREHEQLAIFHLDTFETIYTTN